MAIPNRVDEVTPAWLSEVLGVDIAAVEVLDALAHEQNRLFSAYSWIAATTTAATGSGWQPADVGHRAMQRTTQAIIDLDVLALLGDRLGPV
jgi:hypothetical protein